MFYGFVFGAFELFKRKALKTKKNSYHTTALLWIENMFKTNLK